jgi:hypothetical protein
LCDQIKITSTSPSPTPIPTLLHSLTSSVHSSRKPKNIAKNTKTGLTEHVPDSLGQCCDFEGALPGASIALVLELFEGVWIVYADG